MLKTILRVFFTLIIGFVLGVIGGEFKALALPYKFLGWDNPEVGAPPTLGQHTDDVLRERLGYTPEKIAELRSLKAVA